VIQELIVTSAKRALQAGRSGFAAVMRTRSMHPELQSRLESLSGYRHLFPQGDSRNPVIKSHSIVDSVAGTFSVFSRNVDAGSDYSGRSNKLAHHLAFDSAEIRAAIHSSPAAALQWLQRNGRFASQWEGDPREQEPAPPVTLPLSEPAKCTAWEKATGDAGWAGVLVERTLRGLPTWIIVSTDGDPVDLFVEAMALMEPSKRWAVSFTTHAMSDAGFTWKVAAEGSAEARAAKEYNAEVVIDLTRPSSIGDDGPYVRAARGLAEVPWKKAVALKPASSDSVSVTSRPSAEPRDSGLLNHREPRVMEAAVRPTPPPLVKPPPVVPPPELPGDTVIFPGGQAGKSLTGRTNQSLIAAAVAVGILAAALLGLLLDARLRGERSVIRMVAALVPRETDPQQPPVNSPKIPGNMTPQNTSQVSKQTNVVEKLDGETPPPDVHSEDENAAAKADDSPTKPPASAQNTNKPPDPSDRQATTAASPKPLKKPATPEDDDTLAPGAEGDKKPDGGSFKPVREAVESQHHLPRQPIVAGTKNATILRASAATLVVLKPGASPPFIEELVLVPVTGPLLLKAASRNGQESRWECTTTDNTATAAEVGTFVLNSSGLSFEAAAPRQDAIEHLSRCCLLMIGRDGSEATFLQLSSPIEVAAVPFTLEHRQEDTRGVLQSTLHVPLPAFANLTGGQEPVDVTVRVTGAIAAHPELFTLSISATNPPDGWQQAAGLTLQQARVPMVFQGTSDGDSLSLELVVSPFADKSQFERLTKAISGGGNINFQQAFWPFVRSELDMTMPKTEAREAVGKPDDNQRVRVLKVLQEKLKPPTKGAAPFPTYVEMLRDVLLASPSLLTSAQAAVDKRAPPPPPARNNDAPDGRDDKKEVKDEKPAFDRDAEIMKEKDLLFPTWCQDRLRQLEARRQEWTTADESKWTADDFEDYAALVLWSRIQHLDQCVKAFKLPERPAPITGTARVEVSRIWPTSELPEGASCRPKTLLVRTAP
jgi:hypothetical protein